MGTKIRETDPIDQQELLPDAEPLAANGYQIAQQVAAEEGRAHQPIDQRTGQPVGAGVLTREQREAELRKQAAADELELTAYIETVRVAVGEPVPAGAAAGAFDQRKADQLLREALERLAASSDNSGLALRALQRLDAEIHVERRPDRATW
jgi:hypothetical protein